MKTLRAFSLGLLLLLASSFSVYACPLEPNAEDFEGAEWSLHQSLGIIVRFPFPDGYVYYAHPEIAPYGSGYPCIRHPKGGCKNIIYDYEMMEMIFVDGNFYHITRIIPSMCREEGSDWQAFYLISDK
jgi:hypothetical protein